MQQPIWGLFVVLCSTGACSGSSTHAGSSAGSTSNTGGGNTGGAGVDAESGAAGVGALLPQGALTFRVEAAMPQVDQMACPVTETYEVGMPAPSAGDPGEGLVTGENGATVSCSIVGQSAFTFSGSVRATTSEGDLISIEFGNGTVGADGAGTADVALYTPELSAEFNSDEPCSIAIMGQWLKPRGIWATVQCAQLSSPPSGLCELAGAVVFLNCDEH